jgi:hypothetical protein
MAEQATYSASWWSAAVSLEDDCPCPMLVGSSSLLPLGVRCRSFQQPSKATQAAGAIDRFDATTVTKSALTKLIATCPKLF